MNDSSKNTAIRRFQISVRTLLAAVAIIAGLVSIARFLAVDDRFWSEVCAVGGFRAVDSQLPGAALVDFDFRKVRRVHVWGWGATRSEFRYCVITPRRNTANRDRVTQENDGVVLADGRKIAARRQAILVFAKREPIEVELPKAIVDEIDALESDGTWSSARYDRMTLRLLHGVILPKHPELLDEFGGPNWLSIKSTERPKLLERSREKLRQAGILPPLDP